MNDSKKLFSRISFFDATRDLEKQIANEINQFQAEYLLKVSTEDVIEYLIDKYSMACPIIERDKIELNDHGETTIHVENYRSIGERRVNFYEFSVPYIGDRGLFDYQPSTSNYIFPSAEVRDSEIIVYLTSLNDNADEVKFTLDKILSDIIMYLVWLKQDADKWNNQIKSSISVQVRNRKEKFLKDQGIVASLGFPIRRRTNLPQTYIASVRRKKIALSRPAVSSEAYEAEPALEEKEYEYILQTLSNMVTVMERSPHAFSGMSEEDLRTHFLVHLNGIYEGHATGETFNFDGKTDILIRVNGKNIFIAECKFWTGPKDLNDTIDQVLNYLSWRDTKVAILLFNRNRDFSQVLSKIPDVISGHKNFKRRLNYQNETGFRFVLHNNLDKNRELIATLLAFDVPK